MSLLTGKTVLLVDDEAFLREALREEVESMGARGIEAENGKLAITHLEAERVDVVVSDLRMAGGSGLELLQRAPQVQKICPPFVLLTGATEIDTPELYALGVWSILEKPVSLHRLRAELEKAACDPRNLWDGTAKFLLPNAPAEGRQSFSVTFPSVEGYFTAGRGGFFLRLERGTPPWGSRVQFDITFKEGPLSRLTGTGTVRWNRTAGTSTLSAGCGIEIETLNPASLEAWLTHIESLTSCAFIPKS